MATHELAASIDDMYDLTDVQSRILRTCLKAPGEGMHRMNLIFEYDGTLDEALFERSWAYIIRKYTCFRTSFHAGNLPAPIQVVRNDATFHWDIIDLSELPASEREEAFQQMLDADKNRDFLFEKAPIMRLDLVKEGPEGFKLWWRFPEILMDGWNVPLVLRDFLCVYRSLLETGREPEMGFAYPYRDYVAWLRQRDLEREEAFWNEYLQGVLLPRMPQTNTGGASKRLDLDISHLHEGLLKFAKEHEITLNALFQCLFFLAMDKHHGSGAFDFVMGVTVADRPLELDGIQERVGLYLNTLPVRCRCEEQTPLISMAQRFHREMMALFGFSSSSDRQIRSWCDLPEDQALFNCMFVFENMPVQEEDYDGLGFHLRGWNFENRPSAPMNLFVWPGHEMNLKLIFDEAVCNEENALSLLGSMESMLVALLANGDLTAEQLTKVGAV